MAFVNFKHGCKAEAIDDCGVWYRCTVVSNSEEAVTVKFDCWSSEWNRDICDPREIRNVTATVDHGVKRKRSTSSHKNPQMSKIFKDDVLWMGEHQAVVKEVDPIRGEIKVTLPSNVEVSVGPEDLSFTKPRLDEPQKKKQRKRESKNSPNTRPSEPEPTQEPPQDPMASPVELNFDFCVFVQDDLVFKVGSLCFVESCSFPFIITRLFKSTLNGTIFVSAVRCVCEGGKVVSLLHNFQVSVECSFVRPCGSSEFCLSKVSSEVSNYVFCGQSRVCVCQERNFGNVHYLRELRCHALGAQMRQAILSGISFNATRPTQPVSLGVFEPFHDMAIFGLSEMNKFRIPFTLAGGYSVLDRIMGKGWDVKPLHAGVADCHFKFVNLLTVYLDKKHFTLKFSFLYSEAPFPLGPDYREKCKALSR